LGIRKQGAAAVPANDPRIVFRNTIRDNARNFESICTSPIAAPIPIALTPSLVLKSKRFYCREQTGYKNDRAGNEKNALKNIHL
jgi:hypothetical protein